MCAEALRKRYNALVWNWAALSPWKIIIKFILGCQQDPCLFVCHNCSAVTEIRVHDAGKSLE